MELAVLRGRRRAPEFAPVPDFLPATIAVVEAEPPKSVLGPGESEGINTAIIDAPKAAKAAEIQWKPH